MSRESAVTTNSLIEQLVSRASGAEAGSGNRIEILLDSTENFPAWEAAMLAAEESICIEMYIFADNAFGRRVRDILLEKLSQGVTVVLAYDWLGCLPAHLTGFFRPLREAGAHITAYNPPGLSLGLGMVSRNHRKSIIIDEQTAFVGGLCISSAWEGDPNRGIAPWRATGLRIDGPAVHDIMAAFADTLASQGKSLPATLKNYERGTLDPCGDIQARVLATTPDNTNTVRLDLNLIGLARDNLWITDAYFMPTRMYTQALINAAAAGVDVRILVPRTSDIKWIGTVSRTQYRQLLDAGVRVFEWDGTMLHAKSALIDGTWARVGSTNLNLSSWYANRELDISIEDSDTVAELEKIFLDDLQHATEVVLDEQSHTQLLRRRARAWKRPYRRGRVNGMVRRPLQLAAMLDGQLGKIRPVAPSEAWAQLSIGAAFLLAAVLLWLLPQLVVWPLLFLLAAAGIGTVVQAARRLYRLPKK